MFYVRNLCLCGLVGPENCNSALIVNLLSRLPPAHQRTDLQLQLLEPRSYQKIKP